jgi:hypothetical protein
MPFDGVGLDSMKVVESRYATHLRHRVVKYIRRET